MNNINNHNKPKLQVSLRGGFSDRNGIKPENTQMQYNTLDNRARTAIANGINALYHAIFSSFAFDCNRKKNNLWLRVLSDVYQKQVDYSQSVYYDENKMFDLINETIYKDDYDSVLTIFEFLLNSFQEINEFGQIHVKDYVNSLLEQEYVGYRYIDGKIVTITDEQEISAIEESLSSPFQKSANLLKKALNLFSDRDNPDYSNSIKESISAVEAICSEILGESKSLGAALDKLEKKGINIHPSLKAAFDKLFGYTSDAAGIRHSGQLDGKDSTFDEAKFMLVSCSAFVNYLKGTVSSSKLK